MNGIFGINLYYYLAVHNSNQGDVPRSAGLETNPLDDDLLLAVQRSRKARQKGGSFKLACVALLI